MSKWKFLSHGKVGAWKWCAQMCVCVCVSIAVNWTRNNCSPVKTVEAKLWSSFCKMCTKKCVITTVLLVPLYARSNVMKIFYEYTTLLYSHLFWRCGFLYLRHYLTLHITDRCLIGATQIPFVFHTYCYRLALGSGGQDHFTTLLQQSTCARKDCCEWN